MSDIPNRLGPEFAALIGIDWGDTKHAWAVQAEGSTQVEQGEMAHTPEAIQEWAWSCGGDSPLGAWRSRWSNRAAPWCSP
jgi:hypothetical protein